MVTSLPAALAPLAIIIAATALSSSPLNKTIVVPLFVCVTSIFYFLLLNNSVNFITKIVESNKRMSSLFDPTFNII